MGVPTLGQFSLPGSALQVGRYRGEREREEERKEEGGRERKREGGRERGRERELVELWQINSENTGEVDTGSVHEQSKTENTPKRSRLYLCGCLNTAQRN